MKYTHLKICNFGTLLDKANKLALMKKKKLLMDNKEFELWKSLLRKELS